jgi:hypothetical protein
MSFSPDGSEVLLEEDTATSNDNIGRTYEVCSVSSYSCASVPQKFGPNDIEPGVWVPNGDFPVASSPTLQALKWWNVKAGGYDVLPAVFQEFQHQGGNIEAILPTGLMAAVRAALQ